MSTAAAPGPGRSAVAPPDDIQPAPHPSLKSWWEAAREMLGPGFSRGPDGAVGD